MSELVQCGWVPVYHQPHPYGLLFRGHGGAPCEQEAEAKYRSDGGMQYPWNPPAAYGPYIDDWNDVQREDVYSESERFNHGTPRSGHGFLSGDHDVERGRGPHARSGNTTCEQGPSNALLMLTTMLMTKKRVPVNRWMRLQ